mmetsp:Transcript_31101/g.54057  ORF Transcript_31101/g.54057 Transcript_31101/m.54057 type:complete len:311 (+) Transcript_31101:1054-1986(+)
MDQAVVVAAFQAMMPDVRVVGAGRDTNYTVSPLSAHETLFKAPSPAVVRALDFTPPAYDEFILQVRTILGDTYDMPASSELLIAEAKAILSDTTGISIDQIRLVYSGETLVDDMTLAHYNIREGATLNLLLMLRGGGIPTYALNSEHFDPPFDYDFTKIDDGNKVFKRGGERYYRPCGWYRIAIKVAGKYENDVWLGHKNIPGEWPVSYHGTSLVEARNIADHGYSVHNERRDDSRRDQSLASGIYTTSNLSSAEAYGQTFTHNGITYKVVLQNRVNPVDMKKVNGDQFFVTKNLRDIRPYGILIKQVRS